MISKKCVKFLYQLQKYHMNMMSGDDLVLPPSSNKKCEKFRKPISGTAYNFSATGDKATNNM